MLQCILTDIKNKPSNMTKPAEPSDRSLLPNYMWSEIIPRDKWFENRITHRLDRLRSWIPGETSISDLICQVAYAAEDKEDVTVPFAAAHGAHILVCLWANRGSFPPNIQSRYYADLAEVEKAFWALNWSVHLYRQYAVGWTDLSSTDLWPPSKYASLYCPFYDAPTLETRWVLIALVDRCRIRGHSTL